MKNLFIENGNSFWNNEKYRTLSKAEKLIFLFLNQQWLLNECKRFEYSDYKMMKDLGLSRPTIINGRKKLKKVNLLKFHHHNGLPTLYWFEVTKQKKIKNISEKLQKTEQKSLFETSEQSNIPSKEEFMAFARASDLFDEKLANTISRKYDEWKSRTKSPLNGSWEKSLNLFMFGLSSKRHIGKIPKIKHLNFDKKK